MSRPELSKLACSISRSGIGNFFLQAEGMKDLVSLAVGEPDFPTPWHIREAAIHQLNLGNTFYTSCNGFPELRQAIVNYQARRFKVHYDPSEVMITTGCSQGIDLVTRIFVNPGDEVIVPTPGYVCYGPDTLLAGGKPVYLELKEENQFKVTPEALEKAITPKTKMLILNYPSNPTGGIMTKADYEKIIPIIKKHKIIVLADEIYAELTYAGKHCSLGNFPEIKDQLILMNGISKAYSMTGWRLGYILADKEIIQALSIIQDYVLISAPTITQYAAIEALNHGDKDATMMKESFEERRNYLVSECNRIGLTCHSPLGAFYVFPNIKKTGLSSYELASRLMKEAKVAVIPGSAFGPAGEGYIRLSYSYSIDQIKEAISRIEAFLKTL